MPAAKTLKQAKAAYKSRATSANPLSEREQKQLERSAALDRRAWGLREREKARVNAVKKRAEKEKAEKEERKTLDDQEDRRRDRHGFLASQLCLGAFFGKGGFGGKVGREEGPEKEYGGDQERADEKEQKEFERERTEFDVGGDTEEEDFQDVDDDSLLEALKSPEVQRKELIQERQSKAPGSMPPPPLPPLHFAQAQQRQALQLKQPTQRSPPPPPVAQFSSHLWQDLDFVDTSTQIAREINPTQTPTLVAFAPESHKYSPHQQPKIAPQHSLPELNKSDVCNTSFGSCGSFDLTEAELEELDPTPPPAIAKSHVHDELNKQEIQMPPPTLQVEKTSDVRSPSRDPSGQEQQARSSMPPPALPASKPSIRRPAGLPVKKQSSQRARMLPPALPPAFSKQMAASNTDVGKCSMPLLPLPRPASRESGPQLPRMPGAYRRGGRPRMQVKGPRSLDEKENAFTITELESFVDDDLQLTQAC